MRLLAGQLNQRITIQEGLGTSDGAGGTIKTWSDVAKGWAAVVPLTGGEPFRQGIENATQLYRLTIRYRTGLTARNRLIWNGVPLNIRTCADPDGRREALVITAESGVGEP